MLITKGKLWIGCVEAEDRLCSITVVRVVLRTCCFEAFKDDPVNTAAYHYAMGSYQALSEHI